MAAPVYPVWVTRWLSGRWRQMKRPPTVRPTRPLALADKVANRREQAGEATCITEMSVMMACWKQNDFNDAACAEEIRMFYDCVAKAEVFQLYDELEIKSVSKADSRSSAFESLVIIEPSGIKERRNLNEDDSLLARGNLTSNQVNKLLRRFPQITHYV